MTDTEWKSFTMLSMLISGIEFFYRPVTNENTKQKFIPITTEDKTILLDTTDHRHKETVEELFELLWYNENGVWKQIK